jgi:hypothetical protein
MLQELITKKINIVISFVAINYFLSQTKVIAMKHPHIAM